MPKIRLDRDRFLQASDAQQGGGLKRCQRRFHRDGWTLSLINIIIYLGESSVRGGNGMVALARECLAATVRTLLVQPDQLCREGLSRLLREFPGFCVMPPVASPSEALALAADASPNLVVTEIDLPSDDGLEFIDQLLRLPEPPTVVILSRQTGWAHVRAALGRGARGYLPRNSSPGELQEALRRVLRGQRYVHPALAVDLVDMAIGSRERNLTERESALLVRLSRGETNQEIAQALFLSEKTVRNGLSRLFHKLKVHNRVAALTVAREVGYL